MQETKLKQPEDCFQISGFIRLYNSNNRFLMEQEFEGRINRDKVYNLLLNQYRDKIEQAGYYLTILIN